MFIERPSKCSSECSKKRAKTIEALAACGAKFELLNSEGVTPLYLAVIDNNETIIRSIVENGADLHYIAPGFQMTALEFAVSYASLDTIKLLSNLGSNIHRRDAIGRSVFHAAAGKGRLDVMKYFNSLGVVVDSDSSNISPLHLAAWYGHLNVVKWCLDECNIPVDITDDKLWTPLHYATEWGKEDVVFYLLEKGANMYAMDNKGKTPLFWGSYSGHTTLLMNMISWNNARKRRP